MALSCFGERTRDKTSDGGMQLFVSRTENMMEGKKSWGFGEKKGHESGMVWGIWGGRGKRESVWLIQREKVRPLSQWAAGLIVVANKVGR